MFERILRTKLVDSFAKFPVVAVCGPRQSGKTTLVRKTFPDLEYVNLEDPSVREIIAGDPKNFLNQHTHGLIIDEMQNLPELFSYLQIYVDIKERPGQYIITGSQQFLLNEKISQSLAGRVAILNLLPLSYLEISEQTDKISLNELIFKGFYPRLYKYDIDAEEFYGNYIQTYIERTLLHKYSGSILKSFLYALK